MHDIALQPPDRWVESLPVCDVPLRWDLAKEAMAGAENPIQVGGMAKGGMAGHGHGGHCTPCILPPPPGPKSAGVSPWPPPFPTPQWKARESLDRALDFRGNVLLAGVTTCCVGCAAWQKNCHLRPRLALGMTSVSVTFVILPWAFSGFSDTIGVAGVGPWSCVGLGA